MTTVSFITSSVNRSGNAKNSSLRPTNIRVSDQIDYEFIILKTTHRVEGRQGRGWETRAFETSMDPQWGSFTQNFPLFMKLVILRAIIAREVYG